MNYAYQDNWTFAFEWGYNAAKSGCHIANCYPFTNGKDHWDWIDGYRYYEKEKENNIRGIVSK